MAQHNKLMRASGYTMLGLIRHPRYRAAEAAAVDLARLWLERTGLTARADWNAGNLPYGEQRKLEIARAMCTRPRLLCLDEPAAGLNPRETHELSELLLAENELRMVWTMRRMLSAVGPNEGIELLMQRLGKTKNNAEFLVSLSKSVEASERA